MIMADDEDLLVYYYVTTWSMCVCVCVFDGICVCDRVCVSVCVSWRGVCWLCVLMPGKRVRGQWTRCGVKALGCVLVFSLGT